MDRDTDFDRIGMDVGRESRVHGLNSSPRSDRSDCDDEGNGLTVTGETWISLSLFGLDRRRLISADGFDSKPIWVIGVILNDICDEENTVRSVSLATRRTSRVHAYVDQSLIAFCLIDERGGEEEGGEEEMVDR